jgi:hypothetical protein
VIHESKALPLIDPNMLVTADFSPTIRGEPAVNYALSLKRRATSCCTNVWSV